MNGETYMVKFSLYTDFAMEHEVIELLAFERHFLRLDSHLIFPGAAAAA
jgi:hypothetical protein